MSHSVKVYWKNHNNEFQNSCSYLKNNIPSETLNTKYATVNAKSYLMKNKKTSVAENSSEGRKTNDLMKSNLLKDTAVIKQPITLQDLCQKDKQKITVLIQELAKFGKEKENALCKLNEMKCEFQRKLKSLEDENQHYMHTEKLLKEQINFYETKFRFLEEEKSGKKNEILKLVGEDDRNLTSFYVLDGDREADGETSSIKSAGMASTKSTDMQSDKSVNDSYAEVFIAQQKKFEMQQKALQEQIEQLQQLQESIIKSNNVNKLTPPMTKNNDPINFDSLADVNNLEEFENSRKLDTYLQSQTKPPKSLQHDKVTPPKSLQHDKVTPFRSSLQFGNGHSLNSNQHARRNKKITDGNNKCLCVMSKQPVYKSMNVKQKDLISRESIDESIDLMQNYKSNNKLYSSNYIKPNSPLKRRHFEPSSLLMMPEYIHPPSTSTSVDHFNSLSKFPFGKNSFKNIGSRSYKDTKHSSAYKPSNSKLKKHVSFEDEERAILNDVFFVN